MSPFFTTKQVGKGIGLGLATVRVWAIPVLAAANADEALLLFERNPPIGRS